MLADLESRLADVLGARLSGPLAGRVFVTPGPADTTSTALLVGVSRVEAVEENFGTGRRPERVPGATDPRRVIRLRCAIRIEVRPGDADTRAETMAALDALLYELDAPELRSASALTAPGDPGFVLDGQVPQSALVTPEQPGQGLPAVELRAEGWFWPPNTPGVAGVAITSALVRTAMLPIGLQPWPLSLRPGDPAVALTLRIGTAGTATLTGERPGDQPLRGTGRARRRCGRPSGSGVGFRWHGGPAGQPPRHRQRRHRGVHLPAAGRACRRSVGGVRGARRRGCRRVRSASSWPAFRWR